MATSGCWRCLIRPNVSPLYDIARNGSSKPPSLAILFSTSLPVAKSPLVNKASQKKGGSEKSSERSSKTLRLKKKAVVKTGRAPAPGERKAIRKRIVLSNANALEVQGMADMTTKFVSPDIGKVFGIPGEVVDQLRAVEAFKTTQCWGLFRRPGTLVREESTEISKLMQDAESSKITSLMIFDGERGTGKSMMLLQSQAIAFLKGWIVLTVPEAQELTMAVTEYSPIPGTSPRIYTQNVYIAKWLGQIAKANNKVLARLNVSKEHTLPMVLQPDISLGRLAELGARDPEIAWVVFQAFWSEITSHGRPPILMTLDGLNHIMKESSYRSPEFELIHSHDLAIVKHFVDYLSGAEKLPNGGAVMAATTKGLHSPSYALSLAAQQQEERQAGQNVSQQDPWTKLDQRAFDSLRAAIIMNLKGLGKVEARGLMEYWAASGVLRQRVDEGTVAERWITAGNGIVGELERGALNVMKI